MPDRIPWSSLEFFSFCRTTKNEEENSIWCSRSDWIRINLTTSNHGLKIAQTRSFWPPPPPSRPPTSPRSSFPNIFEWCVHATLQPTRFEHNTRWPSMKKKKKKELRERGWKSNKLKNSENLHRAQSHEIRSKFGRSAVRLPDKKRVGGDGKSPTEAWPLVRSSSKLPKIDKKLKTWCHLAGPTVSLITASKMSSQFPGIRRDEKFWKS